MKFADAFEKRSSFMLISFINIVMSVSYNNERISEKLSKETEKKRE